MTDKQRNTVLRLLTIDRVTHAEHTYLVRLDVNRKEKLTFAQQSKLRSIDERCSQFYRKAKRQW